MNAPVSFATLYGNAACDTARRYALLKARLLRDYGMGECRFFSAPGRSELGGNHTDHQHGCVLAAAVSPDTVAAVRPNTSNVIRLRSAGFAEEFCVSLSALAPKEEERNTTGALLRGVAARMAALGHRIGGFDAWVHSTVLRGSGLSSSAAFEVLAVCILDGLYNHNRLAPAVGAQIAQYAENEYFGKPCGLMDQTASACGGLVAIDFANPASPQITPLAFDFAAHGYQLVITNTRGSHDDLTDEYAAIPAEMRAVAHALGADVLREVDPARFIAALPTLQHTLPVRSLLRAMHFFEENARVPQLCDALRQGDLRRYFTLVRQSGESSWQWLQNCATGAGKGSLLQLALARSAQLLQGQGACRVHGGGFAGTIQAYVPTALLQTYSAGLEALFGAGACAVLPVRAQGACEVYDLPDAQPLADF